MVCAKRFRCWYSVGLAPRIESGRASSTIVDSDNHVTFRYHRRALSRHRRRSTIHEPANRANDTVDVSKSVELEQRMARLEGLHAEVLETLSVLLKRTTAIQAQLDHLAAKISRL